MSKAKPTLDDLAGLAWWNGCTVPERRYWSDVAGNTGRAVDVWRCYCRVHPDDAQRRREEAARGRAFTEALKALGESDSLGSV